MALINKSTLEFLNGLKYNNNREWFLNNQSAYKEAKNNFESFVQEIINEITVFDPILRGLEVKNCVYRINRDIRFSNDKTLYKSHLGAFIVRGGKKNGDKFGGYYFHIEPGQSMIAGGAYMPPSPWLSAIRENISDDPEQFLKIISEKNFVKYFGEIEGEKLKSAPKGYASDHPHIDLLKFKSYLVTNNVPDEDVLTPGFLKHTVNVFKAMKPLNDFLSNY
ncbi:MAG: DUF2461 domain-containing protein [Bacteroidales bacterium]|nr:DUF2461 domain-containing protein [Bacteroidales bacterium]MBK8884343.1 DUF2461 domain-containing protein [Bacteroidales bacterium]